MQPSPVIDSVPVRQDIMPRTPRVNPVPSIEMSGHIPVREINQFQPPPSVEVSGSQEKVNQDDKNLDKLLTEVNKEVASTDMSTQKKKRFSIGRSQKPAAAVSQPTIAHGGVKPKKYFIVDGAAIIVAAALIAVAVKIYY